ncbi:sarcosine oxidase subunit beta [Saccharopolyspora shandongensis]|uniref:Sarcosine oxidase subunit beta n=1 Tax=Saccharopolyspora shandongensis TaxID=418495 RepID=A0A1H3KEV1_9PSEU|nr:FAD-binding oxidoreductase [Saccharopolyspora shandongensis]SDY50539.1 sarcosine oxidase subunit beta [Saccharopolyspora shandongensis]
MRAEVGSRAELPHHAEVVVIGGGIVGASIAYHLAEAGVTDVVVIERGQVASGSSGKPIGGLRAQFSDPLNIALGARSLQTYARFQSSMGIDISMERVGYLFLLREQADLARFERSVAIQNDMGVSSRMISAAEAQRLCPYVRGESLLGAAFSPDDGHARPPAAAQGFLHAAQVRGVRVFEQTLVVDIRTDGARNIREVQTNRGAVRTSTVIVAAGAWSKSLGAMVGVDLAVEPLRRQLVLTRPLTPTPPRIPFTIDFATSLYFHNCDDGFLLGMSDPTQEYGFHTHYSDEWLPAFNDAARACAPELVDLPIERGWAGLYEMTPDCNALIGQSDSVGRLLYAAGFSGHGFLQAPAVGEVIRDLYLGVPPFVDVTPLSADRFDGSPVRRELNVV